MDKAKSEVIWIKVSPIRQRQTWKSFQIIKLSMIESMVSLWIQWWICKVRTSQLWTIIWWFRKSKILKIFNLMVTLKESSPSEGHLSLCTKKIQRSKILAIPAKTQLNSSLIWEFRMLTTVKVQQWAKQTLNRNQRTHWLRFKAQIITRIKALLKIIISKIQALTKSNFNAYIAVEIFLKVSKLSFNRFKIIRIQVKIKRMKSI